MSMNHDILRWIAFGEVGVSSRTMWLAITGIIDKPQEMGILFNIPLDSHDFSQCFALVNDYNITKEQLQKVKVVFPWYAPIIDNWDKLSALFLSMRGTRFHEFYNYICSLRPECYRIAGYTQTAPYCWQKQPVNA